MTDCAAIFGCRGPVLTADEAAFFREARPWGFILFGRNIETPDQVRSLTAALRDCIGRPDAPILIDQEGGRVQRLGPPYWRSWPAAGELGRLAGNDPSRAREITRLGARLIAHDLSELGITVDCLPVLDIPAPDGHAVIGDRAYGTSPETVSILGRAAAEGLLAGGVLPVIKHIPGHGRARSDSHLNLPVVAADLAALEARDFAPFQTLSDMPMAMTAHVVIQAVDPRWPATLSRRVVGDVIRSHIGFSGLLLSDDITMRALSGPLEERARRARRAGCDVVLCCHGSINDMVRVAEASGPLRGRSLRRADAALARISRRSEPLDPEDARVRFDAALKDPAADERQLPA